MEGCCAEWSSEKDWSRSPFFFGMVDGGCLALACMLFDVALAFFLTCSKKVMARNYSWKNRNSWNLQELTRSFVVRRVLCESFTVGAEWRSDTAWVPCELLLGFDSACQLFAWSDLRREDKTRQCTGWTTLVKSWQIHPNQAQSQVSEHLFPLD